jgi:hypothetical protein
LNVIPDETGLDMSHQGRVKENTSSRRVKSGKQVTQVVVVAMLTDGNGQEQNCVAASIKGNRASK